MPAGQFPDEIWLEILKVYIDILNSKPDYSVKRRYRKVILSVALVCTSLANLALPVLWRETHSLYSMSRIINASAADASLYWDLRGKWVSRIIWNNIGGILIHFLTIGVTNTH